MLCGMRPKVVEPFEAGGIDEVNNSKYLGRPIYWYLCIERGAENFCHLDRHGRKTCKIYGLSEVRGRILCRAKFVFLYFATLHPREVLQVEITLE